MRQSRFKNTTSLVVSLALVTAPVFAQDTSLPDCGDTPVFPCLSVDGAPVADQDAFDALQAQIAAEDAAAQAAAEAEAAAQAAAEADAQAAAAAQAAADAAAEAEAQAAADAAAAEEAAAQAAAEVAAQAAAEAEAQAADSAATEEAAAQAAADEQAQAAAEAEAQAAAEAEAQAAADADAAAAEETAAEDAAAQAATQAAEDAAAQAATQAAEDAAAQAAADAAAAQDAAAPVAEAATAETPAPVVEPAPIISEPATVEEQIAREQTPAETAQEAPVESAAALADLDDAPVAEDVVIEQETLTEQDVRSSTEEFANSVNAAPAPAVQGSSDRDGLSNFQKALIVGLGAVVVGSLLRNGDQVVSNSGDRVVVQRGDNFVVLKDDDVLLRQPGSQVETQTFNDGSTRSIVTRDDGTRVITIRGADGTVQRRARVLADGTQVELFNDTAGSAPVVVSTLPPAPVAFAQGGNVLTLREALAARNRADIGRSFSLNQIRTIPEVRNLAPAVDLDRLTFASGSAAIDPAQTAALTDLGIAMVGIISNDPSQVFLVEGHTDAVGSAAFNLALSDRRAETVALALTEFFGVPPENLITQGYGERFLKVPTLQAERANRRVAIRNVTSLLR
jgi:outer membrane protein OmpA-like peptidoglycan-associated protein